MCGLVGVIGTTSRANRHVFQDMLCLGAKRGPHSTGLIAASRKGAFVLKDVGMPWDLLRSKEYLDNVPGKNWPVLMGHNRWATIGKVTQQNAHPFWHKHIIMMHNGTLTKGDGLDSWYKFDTDSECLAFNIAEHGIKPTYKKLDGAWTVTWWDQEADEFRVVSNGQRPFIFIHSADKKSVYYASEEWMIRFACEGRGIVLEKQAWHLLSHKLYKFTTKRTGEVDYTSEDLEARYVAPFVSSAGVAGKALTQADLYRGYGGWVEWGDEDAEIEEANGYSQPSQTSGNKSIHAMTEAEVVKKHVEAMNATIEANQSFGKAKTIYKTEAEYRGAVSDETCGLCGCDLQDEYQDALVIDQETVACGTCHAFCDLNAVKLI